MRKAFHEQLDALTSSIAEMCGLAGAAMECATQALLQGDLLLAEQVITDHSELIHQTTHAEESAVKLLALQAPVAGDLRAVVSSLQNIADVDRMGALALHVAQLARRRHPAKALPEQVNGYFTRDASQSTSATASKRSCCQETPTEQPNSTMTTTTWTTCTDIFSRCLWTESGNTASPPP
jgi:phosphate uptake regulator